MGYLSLTHGKFLGLKFCVYYRFEILLLGVEVLLLGGQNSRLKLLLEGFHLDILSRTIY